MTDNDKQQDNQASKFVWQPGDIEIISKPKGKKPSGDADKENTDKE